MYSLTGGMVYPIFPKIEFTTVYTTLFLIAASLLAVESG